MATYLKYSQRMKSTPDLDDDQRLMAAREIFEPELANLWVPMIYPDLNEADSTVCSQLVDASQINSNYDPSHF